MQSNRTYTATITCHNCGHQFTPDIPVNKEVYDWMLENYWCPNCNCYLEPEWDPVALQLGDICRENKLVKIIVELTPLWFVLIIWLCCWLFL